LLECDVPKTILITGATDGIGLALARRYHTQCARLLLVGRRPLVTLAPPLFESATYCQADLSQPDCASTVADFLRSQQIARLDLLIHNAGAGYYGPIERQPFASIQELIAVNLRAPIALTHTLLPLLEAARGRLVFISSVTAALPTPDYAVYGATKAALGSFAANLRIELRGRVTVLVIAPGATRTAMHAKSGAPLDRLGWQRFAPPDRVAIAITNAIARGRPTTTIGGGNWLLQFGGRYFGGLIDRYAQRRAP
jgi:short-subunit dehydrogenase